MPQYWVTHRHPKLLFPAEGRNHKQSRTSKAPIQSSTVQKAMKDIVDKQRFGNMIALLRKSCIRQFEAALSTLQNTIVLCPTDQWGQPVGDYPFWQVVYHTLYYLDFYLSPNEAAFVPQSFHRADYEHIGFNADGQPCTADVPYEKDVLLGYVQHCRKKIDEIISAETEQSLAGPSGFWWYKIPRAEFHLNNIRHVQHHASQLSLHLRRAGGTQIKWVGSGWKEQAET